MRGGNYVSWAIWPIFCPMPIRSCRVTIQDLEGVSHTVEVTAATLYEAVAQGLAAIRGHEWVAGIAGDIVKVSVANIPVELTVRLKDFTSWLERKGGLSPREVIERQEDTACGLARRTGLYSAVGVRENSSCRSPRQTGPVFLAFRDICHLSTNPVTGKIPSETPCVSQV